MKFKLPLIAILLLPYICYCQTTPWSSTPAVTSQTRVFNGTKQIRWLWSTNLFSISDSLGNFLPKNNPAFNGLLTGPNITTNMLKFGGNTDTSRTFLLKKSTNISYLTNRMTDDLVNDGFQWDLKNDAGDSLILATWTPDSIAFKRRLNAPIIYQNGKKVAYDDSVIHTTRNEAWTGDKRSSGNFTSLVYLLGDGTSNISTGNSWAFGQNSDYNVMRWVSPTTGIGTSMLFLKDGSDKMIFQRWNGGSEENGGVFDFNGTLRAENTPANPKDVLRLQDTSIINAASSSKYVKKSGDVMPDSLYVGKQFKVQKDGFIANGHSPQLSIQQGLAYDGTNYYGAGNTYLVKYNSSWGVTDSVNKSTLSVTGDHFGDPVIKSGVAYIPLESFTSIDQFSNQQALMLDVTTTGMPKIGTVSLSAQGDEVSAFTIIGNYLYSASYTQGSRLRRYDLNNSLAYVDSVHLSVTLPLIQGITYGNNRIYYATEKGLFSSNVTGGDIQMEAQAQGFNELEGIEYVGGNLKWLITSQTAATKYAYDYIPGTVSEFYVNKKADAFMHGNVNIDQTLSVGTTNKEAPVNIYNRNFNQIVMQNGPSSKAYLGFTNDAWLTNNAYFNGISWRPVSASVTSQAIGLSRGNNSVDIRNADTTALGSAQNWIIMRFTKAGMFPTSAGQSIGQATAAGTISQVFNNNLINYNNYGTTNFERVRQFYYNNIYNIQSEAGGTGTQRPIQLKVQNADSSSVFSYTINFSGANKHVWNTPSVTANSSSLYSFNGTMAQASTTNYAMSITPTIAQSSTAGYGALLINPTESSVGSSASKLLIRGQVGGTDKFTVLNTGQINSASLTASLPVFTDASKNLVSNAVTGTGSVVMSASPTLTGTPKSPTLVITGITAGTTGTDSLLVKKSSDNKVYKIDPNYYATTTSSANYINRISPIDSISGVANGAQRVGHNLVLQSASATVPGFINNTTQTFSGNKTQTGSLTLTTGTTSVAPLIIPASASLLTSPANGAIESNDELYYTKGGTRFRMPLITPYNASPSVGQIPVGNGTDYAIGNVIGGNGVSVSLATNNITVASTTIAASYSTAATAQTTFTVTIGATQANTTYKVNVTPTALLAAAVFYVTNKTTTTFDVVYLTGITGAVAFDWALFK